MNTKEKIIIEQVMPNKIVYEVNTQELYTIVEKLKKNTQPWGKLNKQEKDIFIAFAEVSPIHIFTPFGTWDLINLNISNRSFEKEKIYRISPYANFIVKK